MDNGLVRFQPHFLMMYLGSHRWSGEDTECFFLMTLMMIYSVWKYFCVFHLFIIDFSLVLCRSILCTIDSFTISYCCLCTPTTFLYRRFDNMCSFILLFTFLLKYHAYNLSTLIRWISLDCCCFWAQVPLGILVFFIPSESPLITILVLWACGSEELELCLTGSLLDPLTLSTGTKELQEAGIH